MNRGLRQVIPAFTAVASLLAGAFLLTPTAARTDQPAYDTVGSIEGETITVQGPMNVEVVQGRTRTILRSGSDIRVNSGQARIDLIEGGQIAICGPAHLSVLKSVNLLTLALDTGVIHARIAGAQPALTIYTAQLQAKPFAISDAPQDTLVGFDPTGAMCIRADSGAVRVEQQLTAQSIIIPQSGEVLITNGSLENLRSGVTHCACDLPFAKNQTSAPQTEVSRLPTAEEMQKANLEAAKANQEAKPNSEPPKVNIEAARTETEAAKPATSTIKAPSARKSAGKESANKEAAANDGPIYQVFMPPLSYDANTKVQAERFDPQLIVLVRRARVRPALVFQGTVKDVPAAATPAAASQPKAAEPAAPQKQAPPPKPAAPSVTDRIRSFFRNLFS